MLTFEQIKELIDLVSERQLEGLEIERSGFRVKIDGRTGAAQAVSVDGSSAPQVVSPSAELASAAPAGGPGLTTAESTATEKEVIAEEGVHLLRSPIVGTFYTSPSPDAEPYVSVGDTVKRGQVLCIVEAMKLMNEIEADEDGVIDKVFPKNAQPVEYSEPLFAVRTA